MDIQEKVYPICPCIQYNRVESVPVSGKVRVLMSYGYDQTQVNRQRIWIIVLAVALVVVSIIAGFFIVSQLLFNAGEGNINLFAVNAITLTYPIEPSNTPEPTKTMTAFPTFTTVPTAIPAVTQTPGATQTTVATGTQQPSNKATPVFLYDVDEVLYLNSSINKNRYWNPSVDVPTVPQPDKKAIEGLLWDSHQQREAIFKSEEYSDLDTLNAGDAVPQMQRYYNRYIVTGDSCYWRISIVDGKFNTVITQYDGNMARTMTMKIETRDYICDGVLKSRIADDGYAYENLVQKFDDGNGGSVWKVIEHPVSVGQ